MTVSSAADLDAVTVANNADWAETHALEGFDPLDYELGGFSARMQLRTTADAATAALDISTTTGEIRFLDDDGWVLAFSVPASAMAAVFPGEYVRDIVINYAGSTIYGGRGSVAVVQGVTRS